MTLEVGADTDRRVAESLGLEFVPAVRSHADETPEMREADRAAAAKGLPYIRELPDGSLTLMPGDDRSGFDFAPSRDWRAAMLSAEVFGLFDCNRYGFVLFFGNRYYGSDGPEWEVNMEDGFEVHHAPTGPLAICRAIVSVAARRFEALLPSNFYNDET